MQQEPLGRGSLPFRKRFGWEAAPHTTNRRHPSPRLRVRGQRTRPHPGWLQTLGWAMSRSKASKMARAVLSTSPPVRMRSSSMKEIAEGGTGMRATKSQRVASQQPLAALGTQAAQASAHTPLHRPWPDPSALLYASRIVCQSGCRVNRQASRHLGPFPAYTCHGHGGAVSKALSATTA